MSDHPEKAKSRGKRGAKKGKRKPQQAASTPEPAPQLEAPVAAPPRKPRPPTPIPWHIPRGLVLLVIGGLFTFLLMANEHQVAHGPGWGIASTLVAVLGLLDLLGLFRRGSATRALAKTAFFPVAGEFILLSPLITVPLALVIATVGILIGGYDGLPVTFIIALAALLPSAVRRPALLVFLIAGFLYLPSLGVYGLWDPWETHYGEVAREILSRDDWISLWWAQEDWFWSKPILIFWMEALSMGSLGVDFHPDANPSHPEWAIRLPIFLLATFALLALHAVVARTWGKRAGLLSAIALATMPYFFFLAHQAITDMPFVATMTMAMAMLGLAMREDPDREVESIGFGPIPISIRPLVLGAIALVVLPQVLYLFSRNVTMVSGPAFAWHADSFLSGSAGNEGIPGNSPGRHVEPFLGGPLAQPMAQGLLWLGGLAIVLLLTHREKRAQSLYMIAFYFFCGLSFMAKGIPGFALPGLVALLYLVANKRWDLLLEGRLRVLLGIVIVAITAMPWYVAMYVRHGPPFTERILIHDHINRLTAGVHGDTGSIHYFIDELGYGLFPWIALIPIALAGWLKLRAWNGSENGRDKREAMMLFALWLGAAFTLFSAMTTKFHHYIFPAVPPVAVLIGIGLDRMLEPAPATFSWRRTLATVLAVLAPFPAVLGVAGLWGDPRGVIPSAVLAPERANWVMEHAWHPMSIAVAPILLGVVLLAGAWGLGWPDRNVKDDRPSPWRPFAITSGLLAGPAVLGLVGRDLSWVTDARPQGYERLIHLFVYNYDRPWPTVFDFRPILTGFAMVAVALALVAAWPKIRAVALRGFIGLSLLFTVWALDVYIIDLSPHWGQRELVHRYYELRRSAAEPLVAWQMNWKGENFYTGNHVTVFVQLENRELNEWIRSHRGQTAFFLLEHGRLSNLRSLMNDSTVEEMTNADLDNKFLLVRAQIGTRAPPPAPPVRQQLH